MMEQKNVIPKTGPNLTMVTRRSKWVLGQPQNLIRSEVNGCSSSYTVRVMTTVYLHMEWGEDKQFLAKRWELY